MQGEESAGKPLPWHPCVLCVLLADWESRGQLGETVEKGFQAVFDFSFFSYSITMWSVDTQFSKIGLYLIFWDFFPTGTNITVLFTSFVPWPQEYLGVFCAAVGSWLGSSVCVQVLSSDQISVFVSPCSPAEPLGTLHHQRQLGHRPPGQVRRWRDNVHLQTPQWDLQHCRGVLLSWWANKWSPWCLCELVFQLFFLVEKKLCGSLLTCNAEMAFSTNTLLL